MLRTILITLLCIFSIPVTLAADQPVFDSAARLKTFFTTPSERHKLDQRRNSGQYNSNLSNNLSLRAPLKVEMQGVLIRGRRSAVAFVNDGNTLQSQKINDDIFANRKSINTSDFSVRLSARHKHLKLKPGQEWNEHSRKVQERYQIKAPEHKTEGLQAPSLRSILE